MKQKIQIREIPAAEVYPLRREILRPGRPASECIFEGDVATGTFHLGAYEEGRLVGVASYMQASNPLFSAIEQFQLRGMAVLPEFEGQGIGKMLLLEGEQKIRKEKEQPLLWFNARISAVGFYEKQNYISIGEEFDVPGVCRHIRMYKRL